MSSEASPSPTQARTSGVERPSDSALQLPIMQKHAAVCEHEIGIGRPVTAPHQRLRHVPDRAGARRGNRLPHDRGARHRRAQRAGHAPVPHLPQRHPEVAADRVPSPLQAGACAAGLARGRSRRTEVGAPASARHVELCGGAHGAFGRGTGGGASRSAGRGADGRRTKVAGAAQAQASARWIARRRWDRASRPPASSRG